MFARLTPIGSCCARPTAVPVAADLSSSGIPNHIIAMPTHGANHLSLQSAGVTECLETDSPSTLSNQRPTSGRRQPPPPSQITFGDIPGFPMKGPEVPLMQTKHRAREPASPDKPLMQGKARVAADGPWPASPAAGSASPSRWRPSSPEAGGIALFDAPSTKIFDQKSGAAKPPDSLRANLQGETTPREHATAAAASPGMQVVHSEPGTRPAGIAHLPVFIPHKRAGAFRQVSSLHGPGLVAQDHVSSLHDMQ